MTAMHLKMAALASLVSGEVWAFFSNQNLKDIYCPGLARVPKGISERAIEELKAANLVIYERTEGQRIIFSLGGMMITPFRLDEFSQWFDGWQQCPKSVCKLLAGAAFRLKCLHRGDEFRLAFAKHFGNAYGRLFHRFSGGNRNSLLAALKEEADEWLNLEGGSHGE